MRNWLNALQVYGHPRVRGMVLLGFSSGLPLLLLLGTLSFWLREAGVPRAAIGHVSWVALTYGLKWLWAPLLDRVPLPGLTRWLGRRRAWMLLAQMMIALALWGMAHTDPAHDLPGLVHWALWVAFFSATQDVVIDAWRIEAVEMVMQGAMVAAYQVGYRVGMIVAGAGVLWLAAAWSGTHSGYAFLAWQHAYSVMSALMSVGMLATLWISETAWQAPQARTLNARTWMSETFVQPFADFFQRYGRRALLLLSLIAIYRMPDVVLDVMSNAFYVDMGYTKAEVATVTKVFGLLMTLLGAGMGGILIARLGVMRVLLLGALLSMAGNALFVWLSSQGHDVHGLMVTVSVDYLAGGVASSALVAYLSSLTSVTFSATQYALLSSLMLLLPKTLAGFSGAFVEHHGYTTFFITTTTLGVPIIALVWWVWRSELRISRLKE